MTQTSVMARFVFNGTEFVDSDGNPMVDRSAPYVPVVPQIMRDIPEYRSPIDGTLISSRSSRRYDLERNNCREWEPSDSPTGGKLRNARFANKIGKPVAEEYRDLPLNQQFRSGDLPPKQEQAA
jgi:hypothetical protein